MKYIDAARSVTQTNVQRLEAILILELALQISNASNKIIIRLFYPSISALRANMQQVAPNGVNSYFDMQVWMTKVRPGPFTDY